MAVSDSELQCLQPGDQIVIISAPEARMLMGEDSVGWVGDMNNYCSHTLTVSMVVDALRSIHPEIRVYVKENGWRWKAAFIAAVITNGEYEQIPFEALDSLLFGGA